MRSPRGPIHMYGARRLLSRSPADKIETRPDQTLTPRMVYCLLPYALAARPIHMYGARDNILVSAAARALSARRAGPKTGLLALAARALRRGS